MAKEKLPIPTEYEEAVIFTQWLELKGYKFSHIAQETFTKSWNTKRKNKAQGVKRGVPDYLIIVPSPKFVENKLVFIELKRIKGGVISEEQKEWIEKLNRCIGVEAHIVKGANEAIKIIENATKFIIF